MPATSSPADRPAPPEGYESWLDWTLGQIDEEAEVAARAELAELREDAKIREDCAVAEAEVTISALRATVERLRALLWGVLYEQEAAQPAARKEAEEFLARARGAGDSK